MVKGSANAQATPSNEFVYLDLKSFLAKSNITLRSLNNPLKNIKKFLITFYMPFPILYIFSQILSTSAKPRFAYNGKVKTLLDKCSAIGVSSEENSDL